MEGFSAVNVFRLQRILTRFKNRFSLSKGRLCFSHKLIIFSLSLESFEALTFFGKLLCIKPHILIWDDKFIADVVISNWAFLYFGAISLRHHLVPLNLEVIKIFIVSGLPILSRLAVVGFGSAWSLLARIFLSWLLTIWWSCRWSWSTSPCWFFIIFACAVLFIEI